MAKLNSWKGLAERAKGLGSDASFSGIVVKDGNVTHGKDSVPLAGVKVTVETAGEIEKRVTVTRLVALNVFAFAAKKKKDNRELYVSVEGRDGAMFVVSVDPKEGAAARQFAAKVNTLGAGA